VASEDVEVADSAKMLAARSFSLSLLLFSVRSNASVWAMSSPTCTSFIFSDLDTFEDSLIDLLTSRG
jgi:hypothetical protein